MRIAPQAWPYALPLLLFSVVAAIWLPWWAALLGAIGFVAILGFFRDPRRVFEGSESALLCPADGLVTAIDRIVDDQLHEDGKGEERVRVVIFLNVFNVHVQRSPCNARVVRSVTREGKKLAAYKQDVDRINASHLTVLEMPDGVRVGVRQIAGLVARRVVPFLEEGDVVERGGLLGLIQFGSRVDVLLPPGYEPLVAVGQKVRTVSTALADIRHNQA